VQGHEDGPNEIADDEGNDGPAEGQSKGGHRESPGDDRQQLDIGAKPNREQIARFAMARAARDLMNRPELQTRRLFAVSHCVSSSSCAFPVSPNFTLFEGASGDDVVHEAGADYSIRALIRAIAVLS
jgi:hypothetical protein